MPPINPVTRSAVDPPSPMAPPYVDDDDDMAMLQQGLDTAENEIRDAVADAYEADARLSDNPTEMFNDIDFTEAEEPSATPELAAMHVEYIPTDEKEHFTRRHATGSPN